MRRIPSHCVVRASWEVVGIVPLCRWRNGVWKRTDSNRFTLMATQTLSAYWIPFHPSRLRLHAISSTKPSRSSPQLIFLPSTKPLLFFRSHSGDARIGCVHVHLLRIVMSCTSHTPRDTQCPIHSGSQTTMYQLKYVLNSLLVANMSVLEKTLKIVYCPLI